MSTNLSTVVGNLPQITSNSTKSKIARSFYSNVVAAKDIMVDRFYDADSTDYESNPYYMFETMEHIKNGDRTKNTYWGKFKRTVKDANGVSLKDANDKDVKEEVEGEIPFKKWVTMCSEIKNTLAFLLSGYVNEIKECYENNGHIFETDPTEQVINYCTDSIDGEYSIALAIIKTAINLREITRICGAEDYESLSSNINTVIAPCFGNSKPGPLLTLIDYFTTFVKVFAAVFVGMVFKKRSSLTLPVIMGVFNVINIMLIPHNCQFSVDFLNCMEEYIINNKPSRQEKSKDKTASRKNPPDNELEPPMQKDNIDKAIGDLSGKNDFDDNYDKINPSDEDMSENDFEDDD